MKVSIQQVDPATCAEQASQVLRTAWTPPCLHYSVPFVRWQLEFPGENPPIAVAAFDGEDPVGFAGVTPRQFRLAGETIPAYILSFVAVNPRARGQGLTRQLYALLARLISRDLPVLAFAEPSSPGERALVGGLSRAGYSHDPLQPCRAFGYMRRTGEPLPMRRASTSATYKDFVAVVDSAESGTIIWNYPTAEQWKHYCADPRGRRMLMLFDPEGRQVGATMTVMAETVSKRGIENIVIIESACLIERSAVVVALAFESAATSDASKLLAPVMASNLSYIDPALIRAAGARAMPSVFNAHLFLPPMQRLLSKVTALNVEVT